MIPEHYEFLEFPKITRLNREMVVTEKIDGTNACVLVDDTCSEVYAASRTQWLTTHTDNKGFYKWTQEHKQELLMLGPGRHHGEWWGGGIGRKYGLAKDDKRFSLFNVSRWNETNTPPCVSVVPTLYRGPFSTTVISDIVNTLRERGSSAVPGWRKPEGVVIFHVDGNMLFKVTCEHDEKPKSQVLHP